MKKAFIILALLLAVCSIEGRAAELNLTCTVDIIDGENYAECDGGSVSTNGTKVYATPRSSLFDVKSVVWRNGSAGTDLTADPLDDSYSAPQQSGFVTVKFGLRSENVTVTFDLNGVDGTAPADQELTLGDLVTKPSDPEHEGFDFHGWFMDMACTKPFDFSTPLDHTMPYQYRSRRVVLKLYAGWDGIADSGFCGKVDDTHDGSQLRWALYKNLGSDTADYLVISGKGEMAEKAFWLWSQIKTVVMEEGVSTIGEAAFRGCTSLMSVTIPASVTTIGQDAFGRCTSLTSVIIPAGVTTIGEGAFWGCSSLMSVTIPASVTTISKDAFLDCTSLTSVTIPASVTTIGQGAFYNCTGLTSVTIPAGVTTIGQDAFFDCTGLMSVTIPASVTTIGQGAFWSCTSLTHVYCYAASIPSTDSSAFAASNYNNATLHVLASAESLYQNTAPWSGFASIVGDLQPLPKCATPSIAFANGELTFDCETEGVEFVCSITTAGSQTNSGSKMSLKDMTSTYTVSVYAAKDGYDPSDAATQTITYQTKAGDTNGDGRITISDAVGIVEMILGN